VGKGAASRLYELQYIRKDGLILAPPEICAVVLLNYEMNIEDKYNSAHYGRKKLVSGNKLTCI